MTSNFDEMIDRRNTASLKWDVEENELPMWVAGHGFCDRTVCSESNEKTLESWDFWLYRDSRSNGMRHMLAGGKKDIILK